MIKAMHGIDFIRDRDWKPKQFSTVQSIINYATRTMPKDLKTLGFGVGIFHGDDYVRFSYGRKY